VTHSDLSKALTPWRDPHSATINVTRVSKRDHDSVKRESYSVTVERSAERAATVSEREPAHN